MWKKILYPLYIVASIGVVCLCLVLFRDKPSDSDYAESMTLNIPREISVNYGETYSLPANYITIQPESSKHLLTYITTNQSGNIVDLKFDGSQFNANLLGYYYITFSIPSRSGVLTDTLKIHIVKPENDYINVEQKLFTLTVNEVYSLSDIFNLTHPASSSIVVTISNDNISYYPLTEKMIINHSGYATVTLDIRYKTKQQRFTFNFTLVDPIVDAPNDDLDKPNTDPTPITIVLKNVTNSITLTVGSTAEIIYEVTGPTNETDQRLQPELTNNICSIALNMAPYVIITANTTGNTSLILTSLADNSVSVTINIIVE